MNKSLGSKAKVVKNLRKKCRNEKPQVKIFQGGSTVRRISDLKKHYQMLFILVQEIMKRKYKVTLSTIFSRAKTSKR